MAVFRTYRTFFIVLAGIILGTIVLLVAMLATRPPRFSDFPEALQYEIEQRGVAVEHVYLSRGFADTLTDEVFSANLSVELATGETLPGRIECRSKRTGCRFTVREIGIYRTPLPELVNVRRIGWLDWIERQLAQVRL